MRKDVKETQAPLVYLPVDLNNCGSQSPGGANGPRWTLICGDLPKVSEVAVEDQVALGLGGHTYVAYANAEYDLGFATLSGTVGYTKSKLEQRNDQSTNPAAIDLPLSPGSPLSQQAYLTFMDPFSKETSYEVRLTSNSSERLFWSVGGYVYDSLTISDSTTYYATLADPAATVRWNGRTKDLKTTGQAIFGQFSYEVLDRLKLGIDGRYTHEKLDFSGSVTIDGATTSAGIEGTQKYNYFTPRFTIDFDASDALHFYANAARGYKTGGFNSNAYGRPQFEYGPESNCSYELGIKGKLMDGKIVYSAAAFYVDWKDIQTQTYIPSSQVSVVGNNLGATSKGFELDATYFVTPGIWLRAAGAFLDPKYKKGTIDGEVTNYCGLLTGTSIPVPGCSNAVGGNTLARIAKTQITVTGNVSIPLSDEFEAYLRADYSYQSGKYSNSLNNDDQGITQLVNARIGISSDNYELAFWVKNLFDVNYIGRATVSLAGAPEGGVTSGVSQTRIYPGERRTLGLRGTFKF